MGTFQDNWQNLIRETVAYLELMREAGFCCIDGAFAVPSPPTPPPARRRPAAGSPNRRSRPAPLSAEQRAALKEALTDPYAHLRAPSAKGPTTPGPAAFPSQPPAAKATGSKRTPAIVLRDRADGAKRIAAARNLDETRQLVAGCLMCDLSAARTNTVPGEGNPKAELVFVGEAPGYHEDMQGKPFVGRAGGLLTDLIAGIGLTRDDVFICNIVKCRPPENREPLPDEMRACEPFLKRQLELIHPRVICLLGRIAIQGLLRDTTPITKMRGQWRAYGGIPVMPTFHPAYLLRYASHMGLAREDLRAAMAKLAELKKQA